MNGQAAFDLIKDLGDVNQMASTLVETALKHSKCRDNITVIVLRL